MSNSGLYCIIKIKLFMVGHTILGINAVTTEVTTILFAIDTRIQAILLYVYCGIHEFYFIAYTSTYSSKFFECCML